MTRRAVLDTNVIASGLGWSGPSSEILDAALEGRLVLLTTPALLAELRRVLAYPKLARVISEPVRLSELVEAVSVLVVPERTVTAVGDESDNRVLEAAVAGVADYIVSGDKHLLGLSAFEGIPILRPAAFLAEVLRAQDD